MFFHANISSTAAWHPEPNTRGTFSILSSCLLTLFLCAYTALHLNISTTARARRWTRLGWFCVALLAPEVIALMAWLQFCEARSISRKANRVLANLRQPLSQHEGLETSNSAREHEAMPRQKWETIHGFYILMGGYVVTDSPRDPGGTITPLGVIFLLENHPEMVPFIKAQDILDRSKSDEVAKTLACLQALWFCIQVVSRFSTGLDVTLLELNTFAHCLCAVGIYGLWWSKPYGINRPTEVSTILDPGVRRALVVRLYNDGMPNWPKQPMLMERVGLGVALWLSITGLVYGGIHLLAWNGSFNSPAQQVLWRISGICISAFFPVTVVMISPADTIRKGTKTRKWTHVGIVSIVCPAAILYVVSRVLLVVEPFIMLGFASESTLKVPNVAKYFSLFG